MGGFQEVNLQKALNVVIRNYSDMVDEELGGDSMLNYLFWSVQSKMSAYNVSSVSTIIQLGEGFRCIRL
jgi:hypothetical protein